MTIANYDNMRFLIVDNIKPSQEILKQFVMRLTTKHVDSTHYAQDVAAICQQKLYDVILLGYDLGENQKNGQQILEELRVNGYINRHCIVILITAEVSQAMVLAALEHKPDHYLCKPYSLSDLDKRLRHCLHKKKAMAQIYQALDDNNPTLVIQRCKQALSVNSPYKAECLGIMSRQYFELQEFKEAKAIYIAYQNQGNCQWATIGLGKVALQENKLKHAEKLFKLLIKNNPLYLSSYDWLAITYEEQFHYILAEEILEQALSLSPRSLTRLKKYAQLCTHNEHFDKATTAYESNYKLAHNSIHHCADNTVKYVQALIEHAPSLPLVDARKVNNKALTFLRKMTRDFKASDIKIHSHFLGACLFDISKEDVLANNELVLGEELLIKEQSNISAERLAAISLTLKKLKKYNLASQLLITCEQYTAIQESQSVVSIKDKAQAEIELALSLYSENKYSEAIIKLQDASTKFPKHIAIKLNLIQVLLVSFESNKTLVSNFQRAKILLLEMTHVRLNNNELERLKKMQKKYQQIAGI
ncbi:response regulator [Colwellia psychrerythraea]|uniref:Response regulator receiver protein n=1 Tax=Colwellia psychrerythraea TaxID=28229 RepID=A0A099KE19_COLPS|nr:response regulator [Colwellia psychrerythraea]KGJ88576.1 response regulator receiver protein [Colwellia psychrerythraea]